MTTMTPEQVAAAIERGEPIELIDVRTAVEFAEVHARGARNIPLDRLDVQRLSAGRRICLICKSGARAAKACARLREAGRDDVAVVEGGTDAWIAADLPVQRRRIAIPLQRQTLLAAGVLVLLGVTLGAWVNPWFYAICAFVGAGLSVAGLTGFCGMAMLLARMPWNRYGSPSCSI